MSKKEEKPDALESAEVLQEKVIGIEHWIETNPRKVVGILGVLLVLAGGYFGYRYYINDQEEQAQKEMFQAARYFEKYIDPLNDSIRLAAEGDGNSLGFRDIIDEFSGTPAASLANFYMGVINIRQGNYKPARLYLEDFDANDLLVQARAYSLIGDTYMEEKDFSNAASYYARASAYKPNKEFTPVYMMKEALAYEKLNQNEKAIQVYEKLISEYGDSPEAQNAKKYLARLGGQS